MDGDVVEIGCGDGRNLARYPAAVTSATAVEPEPHPRSLAIRAATAAPVQVRVVPGWPRRGTPALRTVQRVLDATGWPLLTGGCHTSPDPVGDLEAAGLEVTALRRLRFPDTRIAVPVTPHVPRAARHRGPGGMLGLLGCSCHRDA